MLITPRPVGEGSHLVPLLLDSAIPKVTQGDTSPNASAHPEHCAGDQHMAGDQVWSGLTDQRCDGRGEDRAALHHKGHSSAHHHGKVPSEPAEWVWEVCHGMAVSMGTNMDTDMDTSAGSSLDLLHGAGEGAVGPGSGYGIRLWVWGQPGAWDGRGRRMWMPGGHDRQEPGLTGAGDTGVEAGIGVRGSQELV